MDLPRVTEVLKGFTNYSAVPQNIIGKAAERGKSVHAICAGLAKGEWIPDGMIQEEYRGYVQSYKQWAAQEVSEVLVIEKRYQDETLGYTGQIDLVIRNKAGEVYLVDLKTTIKPQLTHNVQMAAYAHLLANHNITVKGAILVYLDKIGSFPDVQLLGDMGKEMSVFKAALDCWYYFNRKKDNGRKKKNTRETEHSPKDLGDNE